MLWKRNKVNDEIVIADYNKKNATVTDEMLTAIFSDVGRRYGFSEVKAKFSALSDFKVKWTRSYKWADFVVSDYVDRASTEALTNLADVLFSRISGTKAEYGEAFIRYVTDDAVVRDNQKDFLKRTKGLNGTSIGEFHDLVDCVNRLREQGLIPDDLRCELRWDSRATSKAAGCSVLQKVAWVNRELDHKGVPEYVLDYCVYHELCYLIVGFNPGPDGEYQHDRLAEMHPMCEEARLWLRERRMYL